jgi:hypothetical protein
MNEANISFFALLSEISVDNCIACNKKNTPVISSNNKDINPVNMKYKR